MRNIKLTLEYDGADFYGFQQQPGQATIQRALEKALKQLFQKSVKITAASSRTDAGVHAESQIVNFKTSSDLPLYRIERGLNFFLPDSVAVVATEEASADFHARYHAKSKTYEYWIWNLPARPALWRKRVYHEPRPLDLKAMRRAAKLLMGTHDFRALTSEKSIVKGKTFDRPLSFVRRVTNCTLKKNGALIVLTVEADGFLYHMVRNIAGLLVAVGLGKKKAQDVPKILKSRDRKLAGATLPAHALCLTQVHYTARK